MTTHVFDKLADSFAQERVSTCFALLGDANMNFATRLGETGCRMIYVRHEHCAAAAAMAYARKTGQVGVATVTCRFDVLLKLRSPRSWSEVASLEAVTSPAW